MQKPYFNLFDEPWIPCIPLQGDGMPKLFSLRETLTKAHELREIYSDSPLTIAALHRLLLAVLHDVFGPKDIDVWKKLWKGSKWDQNALDAYFQSVYDRFYLFHEQWPFYQVAIIPLNAAKDSLPVAALSTEIASGNNTSLFDHHFDQTAETINLNEATQRLVTYQTFAIGFGISHNAGSQTMRFTDSPAVRGAMILVKGTNLFQTFLLNMRAYPSLYSSRLPDNPTLDKPAWKKAPNEIFAGNRKLPDGYLDFLTWQSRQVSLIPSETTNGVFVSHVRRIQGREMDKENVRDPLKSYRLDKQGKLSVRGFSAERALWRDSEALLNIKSADARTLPENLQILTGLVDSNFIDPTLSLNFQALGLATAEGKAASVSLWRSEHLPMPLNYLKASESISELRKALGMAENVARTLSLAADWLCWLWVKEKAPDWASPKRDNISLFDEWNKNRRRYRKEDADFKGFEAFRRQFPIERDFWWRLEDPFRRYLPGFASDDDNQVVQAIEAWKNEIYNAAQIAWRLTADTLELTPRTLRVQASAEEIFHVQLGRALNPKNSNEGGTDDDLSND